MYIEGNRLTTRNEWQKQTKTEYYRAFQSISEQYRALLSISEHFLYYFQENCGNRNICYKKNSFLKTLRCTRGVELKLSALKSKCAVVQATPFLITFNSVIFAITWQEFWIWANSTSFTLQPALPYLKWTLSVFGRANDFLQRVHWYGRSPVWVLECSCSALFVEYVFSQDSQVNFFTEAWVL